MAPNASAQKNHDDLFPGHVSTLAITDPELIEVFDNFAFDEVLQHGSLDPRTRLMVQLASMIACQALREYPRHRQKLRRVSRKDPDRLTRQRLPT